MIPPDLIFTFKNAEIDTRYLGRYESRAFAQSITRFAICMRANGMRILAEVLLKISRAARYL
jgi:hypothetical protein